MQSSYYEGDGSVSPKKAPLIIGINGIAGAGKDTVANMVSLSLQKDHGLKVVTLTFAGNLKQAASIIFGVPLNYFYDRDKKELNISNWNLSPRQMMQKLGTEACRKGIQDNIWIKSLEASIATSDADVIFITDVRFDNEAEFILAYNGGRVVTIIREGQHTIATSDHASEQPLKESNISYTIRNMEGNAFVAAAGLQTGILSLLNGSGEAHVQ